MDSVFVFVYGTLMRGFSNSPLLRDGIFISKAKTQKEFVLSAHGIPFVSKPEKEEPFKTQIKGELYRVEHSLLYRMDALEGHPYSYKRELTPIVYNDNGAEMTTNAWLYFYPTKSSNIIKSGDYKEYSREQSLWYEHYRSNGREI